MYLHDHSSSLPPVPRAPRWYKITPGCVDCSWRPMRAFAQMHSLHVNSGIRNETNYRFQLKALLKHGNSMGWSTTVLSGFMISCCGLCTTYKIHGQCTWFGNLSYFPTALTLFQVVVVEQNKGDPSILLEEGRDVSVSHWWHWTCWIIIGGTEQVPLNVVSSSSAGNVFQLNKWSVTAVLPISQAELFLWLLLHWDLLVGWWEEPVGT